MSEAFSFAELTRLKLQYTSEGRLVMTRAIDKMHGSPALAVPAGFADRPHLQLFALSFLALFLELTFIRWVPGSVRLVSYYANLMLISSFLGLGLGAMLAERRRNLVRWFPALLAINVLFLAAARHVLLPGSTVELRFFHCPGNRCHELLALLGIFFLNAAVFIPLGSRSVCSFADSRTFEPTRGTSAVASRAR